ncbi:hypothetical protein KVV02_000747 [Mortierella alpina]|uniref:Uncharacterized protein n=1 Tax=Mortierella alpina TaxID=64518 RepID=A0A9P8AB97_MORAP|nr:hypothetical protein KVV02_000747 [Mortierella alpina]
MMHPPSVESAQAMTQAVLMAHLCHRYHDLASIASEPLKQRLHFLALPDGSNLKELLLLWDTNLLSSPISSSSAPTSSQRLVAVEKYIQERWSPDQSPPTPPLLWGCSSWETARVFRRELVSESVQAFVPLGALDSLHILGVLLVEEDSSWAYHNMSIILNSDLGSRAAWELLNGFDKEATPQAHLLIAMDGTSAPRASNVVDQDNKEEDDDSDDDYWGQYGDADESPSPSAQGEPTSSHGTAFVRENLSAYCDTAEDEDEEDDQYWCKYTEHQEEDAKRQKPRTGTEHDDPVPIERGDSQVPGRDGTHADETRRVLACLGDSFAPHGVPAITCADPSLGQVDPTTLSALLERLRAHEADEEGVVKPLAGRGINDYTDCTEEQTADQEPAKTDPDLYFEPTRDLSMEDAMPSSGLRIKITIAIAININIHDHLTQHHGHYCHLRPYPLDL